MDQEPIIPEPTARQVKAARVYFGWTQPEGAKQLGIAMSTLCSLETGARPSQKTTFRTIGAALVANGVAFDAAGNMILPK